jgi:hypothetical protein
MRKKSLLAMFILMALSSGCATVRIPNTRVCTTAGVMSQGAICAETLTGTTQELTLDEWIAFLEPTDKRAGALCQSTEDWNKQKIALELACRKLGKACSLEVKRAFRGYTRRIELLQSRAIRR